MSTINEQLKHQLMNRVKEQVDLEVKGDVHALYEFTLPEIREKRITERTDEPDLTKKEIANFVAKVESAEVESIDISKFHKEAPLYSNCPAATVLSRVVYNNQATANKFCTVWVLFNEVWYSTALNRRRF